MKEQNMKENAKEEILEETLDEKKSEEETSEKNEKDRENASKSIEKKERIRTVAAYLTLIILSIAGICFIFNFFNTCCTGDRTYHERECDWCGRFEECKMYTVSSIKGYNNNGTIKVGYDFMWFGDGCIYKAKNSGKWLKID